MLLAGMMVAFKKPLLRDKIVWNKFALTRRVSGRIA